MTNAEIKKLMESKGHKVFDVFGDDKVIVRVEKGKFQKSIIVDRKTGKVLEIR